MSLARQSTITSTCASRAYHKVEARSRRHAVLSVGDVQPHLQPLVVFAYDGCARLDHRASLAGRCGSILALVNLPNVDLRARFAYGIPINSLINHDVDGRKENRDRLQSIALLYVFELKHHMLAFYPSRKLATSSATNASRAHFGS